jgi:hypothetical protein
VIAGFVEQDIAIINGTTLLSLSRAKAGAISRPSRRSVNPISK